ncbi:DUF4349 domain-containing protein [Psychrobacter aestuarii]|uniref:DUF4349 domain-containing protein n=1 Tax=Psychrobacter aestuarii TaxID=556327 RepID=A0ABP3FC45_9GAMM|nr:DUF4349 domain-containing protein [Psychrobacter aestuarii]
MHLSASPTTTAPSAPHARWQLLASSMLLLTALAGCSAPEQEMATQDSYEESATEEVQAVADLEAGADDAGTVTELGGNSEMTLGSQSVNQNVAGKTLLVNMRADFKVKDVVDSSIAIEKLTQQQGGYVAESLISNVETGSRDYEVDGKQIRLTNYYRQATMTVRVPKENVDTFLTAMRKQVVFLNEQAFSAKDVTLDIYREQLAAQLNTDISAALSEQQLENESTKTQRGNIHTIDRTYNARARADYAKLQRLAIEDKVRYSTIELKFNQPVSSYKEVTQSMTQLMIDERPSFGSQLSNQLYKGWETLRTALLVLAEGWWLLVFAGVLYLIYRVLKVIVLAVTRWTKPSNAAQTPSLTKENPPQKKVFLNESDDKDKP